MRGQPGAAQRRDRSGEPPVAAEISVARSDGAIRVASWARGARPRRAEPARTAAHLKGRTAPGAVAASSHVPTGAVRGVLRKAVQQAEAP